MKLARLTLALVLAVAALPAFAQHDDDSDNDIDKVNGSITAVAGRAYEDLSTVNGSIKVEDNAQARDVETVNGSISAGNSIRVDSLSTVNGGIRIGSTAQIRDDVETVNGSIFVDRGGNIGHDVTTVNGAIGLVDTDLGGGIETVNGDITVGIGSHVRGGIHVEKPNGNGWFNNSKRKPPRIVIGPNAQVDGALIFEREVVLYVHTSAKVGRISGATPIAFSTPTAPDSRED